MTQQELLLETIAYYSVNPTERRCARFTGRCYYSPEAAGKSLSEGCAIGRKLPRGTTKFLDQTYESGMSIIDILREQPKELFPEWMLEMDWGFLRDLQNLHDRPRNWNERGLTQEGKRHVNMMIHDFGLNIPQYEL